MKPDISVIIPAYNAERYLQDCVESVVEQTFSRLEVIIVDDGSTDETPAIAERLSRKHSDMVSYVRVPNGGVTRARLTGVRAARGDWIGFVDSDDRIDPDMYERLMKNAADYGADISHCGYRTIVSEQRVHYFYNTGRLILQDHQTGLKDLIEGSFVEPGVWNKLYHKSLFRYLLNGDVVESSIRFTEDLLMNYYLFREANGAVFEDFCPYQYLVHDATATRAKTDQALMAQRALDPVKVMKTICDDVDPEMRPLCDRRLLMTEMGAYGYLFDKPEFRAIAKSIKEDMLGRKTIWNSLRRIDGVKIRLLLAWPGGYRLLYHFYERFFQNKVYE